MEDALGNIERGVFTRTCTKYDKLQELRESFGPRVDWDELMELTREGKLPSAGFFKLTSNYEHRSVEWISAFQDEDGEEDFDFVWSSLIFIEESVIADITDETEQSPQEIFEGEADVLLLDSDTMKALNPSINREIIRNQFEYVYRLLSRNRENVVMLAVFLGLYSGEAKIETMGKEFDSIEEYHSFCDSYFDSDYHSDLYRRCLDKIYD
jgi:hypothetical protein